VAEKKIYDVIFGAVCMPNLKLAAIWFTEGNSSYTEPSRGGKAVCYVVKPLVSGWKLFREKNSAYAAEDSIWQLEKSCE